MADAVAEKQWFGHPRGLSTLFFTEMWERFSYYGMRAMLFLFMTTSIMERNPGLGFSTAKAGAIYGLYTSLVYLLALPGGWVADRLWGQKRAVFVGGCIIAAGHFSLAVPSLPFFFFGLALIVVGTGLLKPNVSTIVGDLYPEGGARRDAGFSVFYMGINLGSTLGQIVCPIVGEKHHWHWGFALAGIGMIAGLIQYKLGARHLTGAGDLRTGESREVIDRRSQKFYLIAGAVVAAIVLFGFLVNSGVLPFTLEQIAKAFGYSIIAMAVLYFGYIILAGGYDKTQNKRSLVMFWLFILSAIFWSGFEQAGSSMNLFAKQLTDRMVRGWEMPAGWLQDVNPFLIVVFAPIFGSLWTWLARRNANPSIPMKFGLGMIGLATGFFVLAWGAANASSAHKVSMAWLTVTYFFHTVGELCISPVGLSTVTKLAPRDRVAQMMGIWFVSIALGNLFAGLVAGKLEHLAPSDLFRSVSMIIGGAGLVAILTSPLIKRGLGGVE